jgi:hypothetical protein
MRMKQPFPETFFEVESNISSSRMPNNHPKRANMKSPCILEQSKEILHAPFSDAPSNSPPSAAPMIGEECCSKESLHPVANYSPQHPSHPPQDVAPGLSLLQSCCTSQPNVPSGVSSPPVRDHEVLQRPESYGDQNADPANNHGNVLAYVHSHGRSDIAQQQIKQPGFQQSTNYTAQGCDNSFHLEHHEEGCQPDLHITEPQQLPQVLSSGGRAVIVDVQEPQFSYSITNSDRNLSVQLESRPSSSQSRPHSRRSNHVKSMTRPFPDEEHRLPGASESATLHVNSPAKIRKSKLCQNQVNGGLTSNTSIVSEPQRQQNISKPASDYQKFLQSGQAFVAELDKYEKQKDFIQSQKTEIEKLQGSGAEFETKIKSLEGEKESLTKKIKKLTSLCEKYKMHMNDVVNSQKTLMIEATRIRSETKAVEHAAKEISKEVQQAVANRETYQQNFRNSIKEAKNIAVREEGDLKKVIADRKSVQGLPKFNTYCPQLLEVIFYSRPTSIDG